MFGDIFGWGTPSGTEGIWQVQAIKHPTNIERILITRNDPDLSCEGSGKRDGER